MRIYNITQILSFMHPWDNWRVIIGDIISILSRHLQHNISSINLKGQSWCPGTGGIQVLMTHSTPYGYEIYKRHCQHAGFTPLY